jgi:hypothetical protein
MVSNCGSASLPKFRTRYSGHHFSRLEHVWSVWGCWGPNSYHKMERPLELLLEKIWGLLWVFVGCLEKSCIILVQCYYPQIEQFRAFQPFEGMAPEAWSVKIWGLLWAFVGLV